LPGINLESRPVADQGLVTLPQLGIEGGHDRLAVLAIFLGLRLVSADNVALVLDRHLLGEELRLAALPLDQERHPGGRHSP